VFTLLGLYLLRQRVVLPLRRLSGAARRVGDGDLHVRVPVEGEGEAAQLALAFNEMTEQLESRSEALEKAVVDLREANEQLRTARDSLDRAERLAAVGSLAAGVAHEVGNPMGALLAFQSMALKDPTVSEEVRAYLVKATGQGERVREILRQLLDFSRPPRAQRHAVDLRRTSLQSVGLVQAQARYESVAFSVAEAPRIPHALADESILAQILLNLILNAADAARAEDRPVVRVRFDRRSLSLRTGESCREAARLRSRCDGVACIVEDSGAGVAECDRERIFDPFFSTKPPGEGTGLGLANAQRLAQELGGAIEVGASEELGGASFELILPASGSEVADSDTRETDE
jgi:signal transduction histidine kinase